MNNMNGETVQFILLTKSERLDSKLQLVEKKKKKNPFIVNDTPILNTSFSKINWSVDTIRPKALMWKLSFSTAVFPTQLCIHIFYKTIKYL